MRRLEKVHRDQDILREWWASHSPHCGDDHGYIYVQTYQIAHFKYMQLIVCQLYFNALFLFLFVKTEAQGWGQGQHAPSLLACQVGAPVCLTS